MHVHVYTLHFIVKNVILYSKVLLKVFPEIHVLKKYLPNKHVLESVFLSAFKYKLNDMILKIWLLQKFQSIT